MSRLYPGRPTSSSNFPLTEKYPENIVNHMVNFTRPPLDGTFAALADPPRRAILARLAEGQASVSQLAVPFDISLPAMLKHLRVLERARLIVRTKQGRVSRCRLAAGPLKDAAEWIAFYRQFWERQLEALAQHLAERPEEER